MNITVYLGSSEGNSHVYREAIHELGTWIGQSGHTLVYGGSDSGLMGVLARAVLAEGGAVTGVEPQFFIDAGFAFDGLTELIVTGNMAERKMKMMELGDAFIAFPGGLGTLEEISEIMSLYNLGRLDKPYAIYNLQGFYEPLKQLVRQMTEKGFLPESNREKVRFVENLDEIKKWIAVCDKG